MKNMLRFPAWLPVLLLVLVVAACDRPAENSGNTGEAGESVQNPAEPDKTGEKSVDKVPATTVPENYLKLTNLEMVEYCAVYPPEFEEDPSLSGARGQHVFTSPGKKGRITFTGSPVDMSFKDLYNACVRDVREISGAEPIRPHTGDNQFSMSWQAGGMTHHLHKWYFAELEETVTVQVEYPEAEKVYFDVVIPAITATAPVCGG